MENQTSPIRVSINMDPVPFNDSDVVATSEIQTSLGVPQIDTSRRFDSHNHEESSLFHCTPSLDAADMPWNPISGCRVAGGTGG
jgi:hypothetical protein